VGLWQTLCLLCAAVAWQQSGAATTHAPDAFSSASKRPPTIVYASRTHSQITQVVNELKKTMYAPRTIVLGSRQQMCIHPQVSQLRGAVQNGHCRTLVRNRSCGYHIGVEHFSRPAGCGIQDIEEIAEMGRAHKMCPYYFSRSPAVLSDSDVIFVPYNYIIDRNSRQGLDIDWDNCIVVFDEAHNLDRVCSDSASFDLTAVALAGCMEEVDQATDMLQNEDGLSLAGEDEPLTVEVLCWGVLGCAGACGCSLWRCLTARGWTCSKRSRSRRCWVIWRTAFTK